MPLRPVGPYKRHNPGHEKCPFRTRDRRCNRAFARQGFGRSADICHARQREPGHLAARPLHRVDIGDRAPDARDSLLQLQQAATFSEEARKVLIDRAEAKPQGLTALPQLQLLFRRGSQNSGPIVARPLIEPKPRLARTRRVAKHSLVDAGEAAAERAARTWAPRRLGPQRQRPGRPAPR